MINPRGLNGFLYGAKVAKTDYAQPVQEISQRLQTWFRFRVQVCLYGRKG